MIDRRGRSHDGDVNSQRYCRALHDGGADVSLLNGTLALHDIDGTELFCSRILANFLRARQATLSHADTDDALAYLIGVCWELSVIYRAGKSSSFSGYAYAILSKRIVDWYRSRYAPRDQTNEAWYRRRNPDTQPADPEQRRRFYFPASLQQTDSDGTPSTPPPQPITANAIPWRSLSPRSQATLRLIAIPLSQTSSPTQLTQTLGCSTFTLQKLMDELKTEIVQLLEQPDHHAAP